MSDEDATPVQTEEELNTQEEDAAFTYLDWQKQHVEVLRLKCNTYQIQGTGPPKTLAAKLYKYFHPPATDEESLQYESSIAGENEDVNNVQDAGTEGIRESEIDREIAALKQQTEALDARVDGVDRDAIPQNDDMDRDIDFGDYVGDGDVRGENRRYESEGEISLPGTVSPSWSKRDDSDSSPAKVKPVFKSTRTVAGRNKRRNSRKDIPAKPTRTSADDRLAALMQEMENQRDSQKLRDLEVKALRSDLAAFKKKSHVQPVFHPSATSTRPKQTPPLNVAQSHSNGRKRKNTSTKERVTNKVARMHGSSSRGTKGNTNNNINSSNGFRSTPAIMAAAVQAAVPSPFSMSPPPIKKELMDTIKKEEYVNFNSLKPKNFSRKANDERNRKLEATYNDQGGIEFKSTKNETINNCAEWMEAWNLYFSARLYFDTTCFKDLFGYQTVITNLMVKYNFDAVYTYDIAFRHAVAAERSISPKDRIRQWPKLNDDLANYHLKDELKAPLVCFYCQEEGHLANKCDLKKAHQKSKKHQNQPPALMPSPLLMPFGAQPRFPTPPPSRPNQPPGSGRFRGGNNNPRGNGPPQRPCRQWDNSGFCRFGAGCFSANRHICTICGSTAHAAINCFTQTSGGFRPGP